MSGGVHHPACPARHEPDSECWCLATSGHRVGVHRAAAALWPVAALLALGVLLVWLMV